MLGCGGPKELVRGLAWMCLAGLCGPMASASAQGAQTEIPWLDEVADDKGQATAAQPANPGVPAAADAKALRLKLGTSMFSRYELRRNYGGLEPVDDRIHDFDAVAYRARMYLRTDPIQLGKGLALEIAFVPQASGFWGPSGDNSDASLGLHEGYLRPWFGDRTWLQVGRFEMSYGDEWLIGANSWHETGRSFDGVRFHLNAAKSAAFFDTFLTLLREGRAPTAAASSDGRVGSGDQMLLGAYGDVGPMLADKLHLDPYALLLMNPSSTRYYAPGATTPVKRDSAYEGTIGLRLKGAYGVVDYRVEGGVQFGKRALDAVVVKSLAGAADAELGFNLPGTVRLAANGMFASGDDPNTPDKDEGWADRFSQPHKWLGLSDVIRTRTNITGVGTFLSAAPVAGLDFGVQGHFLFKARYAQPVTTGKADVSAKYAGTEIDPYVGYELAKGLALRAEYGAFIPSSGVYGHEKAAHYFGFQFGYHNPG